MVKEEILEDGTRRVTIDKSGKEQIELYAGQPTEVVFDIDAMVSDRIWKIATCAAVLLLLGSMTYMFLIRR